MNQIERNLAIARFDAALRSLAANTEAIIDANLLIGIPMEDAICAATRKFFAARVADQSQAELPIVETKGDRK